MENESRKPDYRLKARNMDFIGGTVGAGWLNPDGTISIQLNPFVVLNASTRLQITLFPRDDNYDAPS